MRWYYIHCASLYGGGIRYFFRSVSALLNNKCRACAKPRQAKLNHAEPSQASQIRPAQRQFIIQ